MDWVRDLITSGEAPDNAVTVADVMMLMGEGATSESSVRRRLQKGVQEGILESGKFGGITYYWPVEDAED